MNKLTSKQLFQRIIYNPLFILILGAIAITSWALNLGGIGILVLLTVGGLVLAFNRDIMPLLPCLIFTALCATSKNMFSSRLNMILIGIGGGILLVSLIAHLITYKPKFRLFKLTLPLILVSIALILGGVGYLSVDQYFNGAIFIIALGPIMLLAYYIIMLYLNPPAWVKAHNYMCYIMLTLGLIVVAQLITFVLRSESDIVDLIRTSMDFGWGNINSVSMILTLSFPCAFFIGYGRKMTAIPFYIISFLMYFLIFFVGSKLVVIVSSATMLAIIIYSIFKGKNRGYLLYAICTIILAASIYALMFPDKTIGIIEKIFIFEKVSYAGYTTLFTQAYNLFLANPIFGGGLGFASETLLVSDFYLFYSTPFQIMGTLGIVGMVAYGIYYISRAVIMFKNPNPFNIIISIAIIGFEVLCLMDAGTFTPFPFVLIIIVLTAFMEYSNNQHGGKTDTIRMS